MKHGRITIRVLLLAALLVSLPTTALAQKKQKKKPRVVYEKETVIRFDDTMVKGRVIKPDGFFLLRKRPKKWQDLVKVREDFKPELKNMNFEL